MKLDYSIFADQIKDIAYEAGKIILSFGTSYEIERKTDHSPVTSADIAANNYIVTQLQKLTPSIPVIAEENTAEQNQFVGHINPFWLVDPLDGTKSFMRGESTYTVNIALIDQGRVIGGAVYCPALKSNYFVGADGHAYKQLGTEQPKQIKVRALPHNGALVLASSFHLDKSTQLFIDKLPLVDKVTNISSSIKFCILAEGNADIYPRFGPTMEWDTAAGHAVLEAAGGRMQTIEGQDFCYGKKEFRNGNFLACSAPFRF